MLGFLDYIPIELCNIFLYLFCFLENDPEAWSDVDLIFFSSKYLSWVCFQQEAHAVSDVSAVVVILGPIDLIGIATDF